MEYNANEKQALEMMSRTDFKNLSKNDVMSIVSKISELRPDVAKEIIAQFPEFVNLIQISMKEYKEVLGDIISSDDESIKQVYATANKDQETSISSRNKFYDFAEKIHTDISKCLDDPNLSSKEREEMLSHEIEILRLVSEKDMEIRNHETEIVKMVDKKDLEKRQFNSNLVKFAVMVLITSLYIAGVVLRENINIKIPEKK